MTTTITTADAVLRAATTRLNDNAVIDMVTKNSGRDPVARFVNADDVPKPPAPAWYMPQTADIYIHVDEAGIDAAALPEHGSYFHALSNFDAAKAMGLLAHEAAHAAISDGVEVVWDMAPHHRLLLTMLEEIRVENHALRRLPQARRHLRASFTLVLRTISDLDITDKARVAHAWGLVQGRTLAGISTPAETDPLDTAARTLLGDDVVDELTDLLQETVTLHLPHDSVRMIAICDEWVALVGRDDVDESCAGEADGSGAKGTPSSGGGGKGKSETDDGGASTAGGKDGGDDTAGGSAGDDDHTDVEGTGIGRPDAAAAVDPHDDDPEPISEEGTELATAMIKDLTEAMHEQWMDPEPSEQRANAAEWAARVFGSTRVYKAISYHEPTVKHRQDVVKVSGVLSNLSLPAIAKVTRPMPLPPGRLRSREAVRASAERAQGQMVTANPWRGTVRRHSNARPLIVGIATDTSGSMAWAEDAVAEFAYVYANAGHRIGARTAAVTFGSRVYRIARPGEVMTNIAHKPARDSEEQCDYALAALDGVLHLTTPSPAARILLIVSDGALVRSEEPGKVSEWLKLMDQVGTHVVWITDVVPYDGYWLSQLAKNLPNMSVVSARASMYSGTPMTFDELNKAAMEAITRYIR
ncbi:MAG TPA: hypothetical protein VIQ02_17820 [Jiangellaceae bacterium]